MEVALNAMKGSISELLEITRSPALWDPRADRTRTQHGPLILALNNALVKKNEKIICQVYEDPKLVFTIEWLNVMRPLTSSEIKEIVNKLGVRLESVNSLIDRGFFSGPSDLDSLFAAAPIHLLHHYPMYRINRWFGIRKVFDKVNTEDMKDLIQRIVQMVVAEVAKSAFNTIVFKGWSCPTSSEKIDHPAICEMKNCGFGPPLAHELKHISLLSLTGNKKYVLVKRKECSRDLLLMPVAVTKNKYTFDFEKKEVKDNHKRKRDEDDIIKDCKEEFVTDAHDNNEIIQNKDAWDTIITTVKKLRDKISSIHFNVKFVNIYYLKNYNLTQNKIK